MSNDNELPLKAIIQIARAAHEANRAYCEALGDMSQLPWPDAPAWQMQSAINGVAFHLDYPDATPEQSHENWCSEKYADGWLYGPTKDADAKTHPCLVPYFDLPTDQRAKDNIFAAVVREGRLLWASISLQHQPTPVGGHAANALR